MLFLFVLVCRTFISRTAAVNLPHRQETARYTKAWRQNNYRFRDKIKVIENILCDDGRMKL